MWKVYNDNDYDDDGQRTNCDQKGSLEQWFTISSHAIIWGVHYVWCGLHFVVTAQKLSSSNIQNILCNKSQKLFVILPGSLCIHSGLAYIHLVNFTMGVLKTQRGSMGLILGYFLLGLVWTVLYSTGISTEIVYLKLYPVDIL